MIKLATIGTSSICDSFVKAALITKEFMLYSVYSRKHETGITFGESFGCKRVYTSLAEMAADTEIDAVYIASPNSFHFEQSRIFLEAGKHVICEKPITTSAKEYSTLKALADKKGLIYMEAIIPRHTVQYGTVHKAFQKIGKPTSARFVFCKRSTRLDILLRGEQVNIFDMSLHAGTLMDLGIYCVWAAVDFFGMPKAITASAEFHTSGADKSGKAIFDYGDFCVELIYSKFENSDLPSEIIGQNGKLNIGLCSQYTDVNLITNSTCERLVDFPERVEFMSGEAQRFADYILRFSQNKNDYDKLSEQCLQVHTCMDRIKKSAGIVYGGKEN